MKGATRQRKLRRPASTWRLCVSRVVRCYRPSGKYGADACWHRSRGAPGAGGGGGRCVQWMTAGATGALACGSSSSGSDAAIDGGKQSAEVRKARHGTAQPKGAPDRPDGVWALEQQGLTVGRWRKVRSALDDDLGGLSMASATKMSSGGPTMSASSRTRRRSSDNVTDQLAAPA
jgi:hypothetical protein